jgi:hypothetical protein
LNTNSALSTLSVPYLIKNASVAIPIVGFLLFLLSVANYLITAFKEPGFLPRASAHEAVDIEKKNGMHKFEHKFEFKNKPKLSTKLKKTSA